MEGLPARPQQEEASDLRRIQEDPLVLPPGRSAHLPEGIALLAQIAMEGTARSEAVAVEAAPEPSPEGVLAAAAASQEVMVGPAESVDQSGEIIKKEDLSILFFCLLVDRDD